MDKLYVAVGECLRGHYVIFLRGIGNVYRILAHDDRKTFLDIVNDNLPKDQGKYALEIEKYMELTATEFRVELYRDATNAVMKAYETYKDQDFLQYKDMPVVRYIYAPETFGKKAENAYFRHLAKRHQ